MQTTSTESLRPRANSIKRTAEVLSVSERTVWRMIGAGHIKAVKLSARRRVITDDEITRVLSGVAA
jgi:excisionase family DNA binding protein